MYETDDSELCKEKVLHFIRRSTSYSTEPARAFFIPPFFTSTRYSAEWIKTKLPDANFLSQGLI